MLIKRAKPKFVGKVSTEIARPFALVSKSVSPRLLQIMSPMSPSLCLKILRN